MTKPIYDWDGYKYEVWSNGRVMSRRDNKGKFMKEHRHLPDGWVKKLSEAHEGQHSSVNTEFKKEHKVNLGRKHNKERIEQNRMIHIGIKHTEEAKQKISKSMKIYRRKLKEGEF